MAIFDENGYGNFTGDYTPEGIDKLSKQIAELTQSLDSARRDVEASSRRLETAVEKTQKAEKQNSGDYRERRAEAEARKSARNYSPKVAEELSKTSEDLTSFRKELRAIEKEQGAESEAFKSLTRSIERAESRIEKLTSYLDRKASALSQERTMQGRAVYNAHEVNSRRNRVRFYQEQESSVRRDFRLGAKTGVAGEVQFQEAQRQIEQARKKYEEAVVGYITQNIANGTLTKEILAKLPKGQAAPIPVKLHEDKAREIHEYRVAGPHAKAVSGALPTTHTYSATELTGIITGSKVDTSEKYRRALLEERRRGGISAQRDTEISQELKKIQNFRDASERGTAFHKLVEMWEKGIITPGKDGGFSASFIQQLGQSGHSLHSPDLKIAQGKKESERLAQMLKEYSELKDSIGLKGAPTTERSLGMVINLGGELVKIAGTLDSFFSEAKMLGDLKTTSHVDSRKVDLQLNILRELMRVNGMGEVSSMGIFHTPFKNSGKMSNVTQVSPMDREQLISLLAKAIRVDHGEEKLTGRELEGRKVQSRFTTQVDAKSGLPISYLNGVSMSKLPELGVEEVIRQVGALTAEELNHFLNALFSTKSYGDDGSVTETDKFYRGSKGQKQFWDDLRTQMPSFFKSLLEGAITGEIGYRTYTSKDPKTGKEEVQGGTTIGGGYLSQWSTAYRTSVASGNTQKAQQIVDQLLRILDRNEDDKTVYNILRKIDELPDRDEIHKTFRDAIYEQLTPHDGRVAQYSRLEQIANDPDQGKKGVREVDKDESAEGNRRRDRAAYNNLEKEYAPFLDMIQRLSEIDFANLNADEFSSFISSLYSLSTAAKNALSTMGDSEQGEVNEEGIPLTLEKSAEFLDEYQQFVSTLRKRLGELQKVLPQEGYESLFQRITGATDIGENLPKLNEQTAHRFSWLYMAQEQYEKALGPDLARYNKDNNANMSMADFAKLRLSPEQYAQYSDSLRLRELGKGKFTTDLISAFTNSTEFKWDSDLASGVKKSISKLIEGIPDEFYNKFYSIVEDQTTLNNGASQKMRHWEGQQVDQRILNGDILRSYSSDYEIPPYTPLQYYENLQEKIEEEIRQREKVFADDGLVEERRKAMRESALAGDFLTKVYKPAVNESDSVTDPMKAISTFDESVDWKRYEDALEEMDAFLQRFGTLGQIRKRAIAEGYEGLEDVRVGDVETVLGKNASNNDIDEYYRLAEQYLQERDRVAAASKDGWGKSAFKMRRGLYADYGRDLRHAEEERAQKEGYYQTTGEAGVIGVMRQMVQELQGLQKAYREEIERQSRMISSGMLLPAGNTSTALLKEEKKDDVVKATEERDVKDSIKETAKETVKEVADEIIKPTDGIGSSGMGGSGRVGGPPSVYGGFNWDVHATSNTSQDMTGWREKSRIVNDEGKVIGITITKALEKVFADYGSGGIAGFIQNARAGGNNKQNRQAVRDELLAILTKVPSYRKSGGGLNANGQKQRQEIMEEIFGVKAKEDVKYTTNKVVIEGSPANIKVTGSPATIEAPGASVSLENPEITAQTSVINISGEVTVNGRLGGSGGGRGGSGSGRHRSGGGDPEKPGKPEETDEERNQRLTEYLALLKEQYSLVLKLHQLDTERGEAEKLQDEVSKKSITEKIQSLEALRELQDKQMREIEEHGFNDKEKARIQSATQRLDVTSNADRVEYDTAEPLRHAIALEKELQGLLNKRASLEGKIAAEQKTIDSSFSRKEKDSLREVIGLQEQEVRMLDEKVKKLIKSGALRKDELANILREYQVQSGLQKAQAAAKDHGSMSLFDKMKYDVQRSMTRVFDYGISAKLLNSIPRGLNKIYQLTQQLNKALTDLRVVTGMNEDQAKSVLITYQKLGKQLGATTQEVAQSATTWLRQGYAVEEAGKLIDASMKLSKLGFMDASKATETITAALKGFKLEVTEAMSIVDKLTSMDQKAAVSAQGVSEALSLMANSARLAGKIYARTYRNIWIYV